MGRQLRSAVTLDDVEDVEAFVATVVHRHWPNLSEIERDEMIGEGFLIACEEYHRLERGERLSRRLQLLDRRLIDAWRKRTKRGKLSNPESFEAMAERGQEPELDRSAPPVDQTDALILKLAAEEIIRRPEDLDDPRVAGSLRDLLPRDGWRYIGLPSHLPASQGERLRYLELREAEDDGFTSKTD